MFDIQTHMDFEGQGRAEKLSRVIITLFGAVGLVWGYIIQQFSQTVYILIAGVLLASILTIPPWPIYRRKPLKWQKPRPQPAQVASGSESSGEPESGKKKKK
ncbi:signal peptidase complex subunit 1 [Uranotaenia lowii]|uniref:signal peptidase complex subunit 1 n=1 Tax=Uranotaenia lowii TaxID=190385 RepID=UPI00247894E9|nr:signal peptidase complex subunit 1 [Uranotaenia lowii]